MSLSTTHVLIIEDEVAIADTLIYACKEAGIATTHYLLGHQALDDLQNNIAQKNNFDCVILDVGLPDVTGFEVCKQIRASSQISISNIPIIFLTARNHEIDRIVGLEIGADDYVTKPFSPREVVARIKAILRRGEPKTQQNNQHANQHTNQHTNQQPNQQPNQLAVQPFLVNDVANRIQYGGQYLTLTRYEFLLLKTLIKQPQRVFSRHQLMDIVWVNAEETLERTVDAHIKTLRAKLRQINTASEVIVTHRGMGYSLLA